MIEMTKAEKGTIENPYDNLQDALDACSFDSSAKTVFIKSKFYIENVEDENVWVWNPPMYLLYLTKDNK